MKRYKVSDTVNGEISDDVYYTSDIFQAVKFIIDHKNDPDYEYLIIEVLDEK